MPKQHFPLPAASLLRGARSRRRVCGPLLALGLMSAAVPLSAGSAHALLLPADAYRNLRASSVFGSGYDPAQLVDGDPLTPWVISGNSGTNPQGRDEGWFSFELTKDYLVNDVLFAPRGPSGTVDGVDLLQVWAAANPFNVDVTDAASTSTFLASNLTPSLQVNGFVATPNLPYSYSVGSLFSRYFLVRLVNQTDSISSRNLGARTFQLQATPVVPAPLPALGLASAFLTARRLRRRCRLG
jgi:hypothetical protein